MINRICLLLVVCSMSVISACGMLFKSEDSVFRGRSNDYLQSQPVKEIQLPDSVEAPAIVPLYPVPEVLATDDFGDDYNLEEYEIPRPKAINSDEQALGVKIQKLGDERWVYLSASTSQVWPRTQSFLTAADVGVVKSNAESGLIETNWLKFKDNDEVMGRFRISLEKGIHPDTTEVHVRQMQVPMGQDVSNVTEWPEVSTDPEREEWLMRELANHLAKTIDNASASLLGQNVGGSMKAFFVTGASEPTLGLNLSHDRAWATLTHSAKNGGFVTWDKSEAQGIIHAGYSEYIVKKKGFFKKVTSLGSDDSLPKEAKYPLAEVLSHLSGKKDVREVFEGIDGVKFDQSLKKLDKGYLIVMTYSDGMAKVIIRDNRGRKIPATEAKTYIRLLRKNLI